MISEFTAAAGSAPRATATYDPGTGRIAIDGVELRDWNLTSLRSQIATIEQDVFLCSPPWTGQFIDGTRLRARRSLDGDLVDTGECLAVAEAWKMASNGL